MALRVRDLTADALFLPYFGGFGGSFPRFRRWSLLDRVAFRVPRCQGWVFRAR